MAGLAVETAQRAGPAREVRAGSGYWSQDSAVQVLAAPESPAQVRVRWSGGRTTTNEIPVAAKEIAVDGSGTFKLIR